jgi:hypothetical protein
MNLATDFTDEDPDLIRVIRGYCFSKFESSLDF